MSGDGTAVVGSVGGGTHRHAALWTPALSSVNLATYLQSLGVSLTGWTLRQANGISTDGRTIVGDGTHNGRTEAWIATLPPACYANCDSSSVAPILNVNDFTCFLNAFAAGSAYANCDRSTTPPILNILDFTCFLNRFAAGCS